MMRLSYINELESYCTSHLISLKFYCIVGIDMSFKWDPTFQWWDKGVAHPWERYWDHNQHVG